jgi:hypothetical protein
LLRRGVAEAWITGRDFDSSAVAAKLESRWTFCQT